MSDESLRRDRTLKQLLYAGHGIPEYWVLALPDACLEVYRDPDASGYRSVATPRAGDRIAPVACHGTAIAVGDLLP